MNSINDFLRDREIKEGFSLITTVKNRTENLLHAINSWIHNTSVSEIVVVDWSSEPALVSCIQALNCQKIVLIKVDGEKYFSIVKAKNLGARFSTYNKILFLDSDILLNRDFFSKHLLRQGSFWAGNWRRARTENETHLNGQCLVWRSDFFAVNGYDERFETYGWDDSNFYQRLSICKLILNLGAFIPSKLFWKFPICGGLKRFDFEPDFLTHLKHDDANRVINYQNDDQLPKYSIEANRAASVSRAPWNKSYMQSQYSIELFGPCLFEAKRIERF